MNTLNLPKRKHYGLLGGLAIAVLIGLFKGTKQQADSQSDFIALVIAFAVIVIVFGGIGFLIDTYLHRKNKKTHQNYVEQKENRERFGEFDDDYNKAQAQQVTSQKNEMP